MKTERRSPMITSGVATPKHARISITTVIAIAATKPAINPVATAFPRESSPGNVMKDYLATDYTDETGSEEESFACHVFPNIRANPCSSVASFLSQCAATWQ